MSRARMVARVGWQNTDLGDLDGRFGRLDVQQDLETRTDLLEAATNTRVVYESIRTDFNTDYVDLQKEVNSVFLVSIDGVHQPEGRYHFSNPRLTLAETVPEDTIISIVGLK